MINSKPVVELKRLLGRLEGSRRRRRAYLILAAAIGLAAALFVLYHISDLLLTLHPHLRVFLGRLFLVILASGPGYALAVLIRPVSMARTAKWLEKLHPELKQEVTTVIQCSEYDLYSAELLAELARGCLARLGGRDLIPDAGRRKLRFLWPLLPTMILIFSWSLWPGEWGLSLKRLLHPWGEHGDWSGIKIFPGDARIAQGEELLIAIENSRERAWAIFDSDSIAPRTIPLTKSGQGLSARLPRAQGSYQYRILLGRRQSRRYSVLVYRPLLLQDIKLIIEPPAYTGIKPLHLANQASFEAPAYSRITVSAQANMEVERARVVFSKTKERRGEVDGDRINFSFVVRQDESYRLEAMAENLSDTFISAEYRISCLPDQPPQIDFVDEERQESFVSDMVLPVSGRARDDYGLSKIGIGYVLQGRERFRPMARPGGVVDTVFDLQWSLADLGLLPGDSLVYWLEAWDNDAVRGPKSGKSQRRRIWIPSLAEMYQDMARRDSAAAAELSQLQPKQSEIREQLQRISQAIKQNRRLDWQQQAAMEQALKEQEALLSRLEQAAEQALKGLRPQGRQLRLDAETASKLRELQELFEQTATQEMRQAMEQLQRALEKMDRQEVARALENMNLTTEELKRRLDQAIAALKEMQQQRQLEGLRENIDKLLKEQRDIKNRTVSADKEELERLAKRQELAAKDLEALAEQAKQLGQRLESSPQAGEKLQRAAESLQKKNTGSMMRKAGQRIAQGQRAEAQELQEQALKDMESLSQAADEAKNSMGQARSRALAKAMRQKAREILSLSQQQEDLNRMMADNGNGNDLAENQQTLVRAGARLQSEIGRELGPMLPPQAMGNLAQALKNMNQSSQDIMGGRNPQAMAQGQQALAALNQAAAALMEASSRAGSQGGGGDMMQELEGLSGQQAAINQQTLGLMPTSGMEPEQLTAEMKSQMARLAAEQEAVRLGLEEFNLKYQDRRDRVQRLDDLVEEMKKVAEDLQQNRVSRQTAERQERILNRLLEAQRSLRDQDFSPERKAESGRYQGQVQTPRRTGVGALPAPADRSWRQEPYPLEYQEIIERYFRSLGW